MTNLKLLLCAGSVYIILEHTRLGRYAFSIGSNPEAAFYAGVPVRFHTTAVYALTGLLPADPPAFPDQGHLHTRYSADSCSCH